GELAFLFARFLERPFRAIRRSLSELLARALGPRELPLDRLARFGRLTAGALFGEEAAALLAEPLRLTERSHRVLAAVDGVSCLSAPERAGHRLGLLAAVGGRALGSARLVRATRQVLDRLADRLGVLFRLLLELLELFGRRGLLERVLDVADVAGVIVREL